MADGSCLKNPVRTPWRETCRLGLGCLLVISVCPGCMHVAYGLYGLSTPLRDVSEHREYWGGYEVGATYILQQDVFIADLRYYSHGPGLAPGTEFPVDKRDPMCRDFIFPVDWTCGCGAGFSMQASREEREIAPALESIKMWRTWTAIGKHSLG